jgi:two-component sensor histidine kinase
MRKIWRWRAPLVISSIYFLFGFLWILLSDTLLEQMSSGPEVYMRMQTLKGWIYVALTTVLIYFLVDFYAVRKNRMLREISAQEQKAQRNLAEKEILLKEVHHRVKNNLQLIESMMRLNLQKKGVSPDRLVQELNGRIHSISLIHEQIYAQDSLNSVRLDSYIEQLQASIVGKIHGVVVGNDLIAAEIDLDRIVPLGIILNEILTNALKYAFPDGRKGKIGISLREEGSRLCLCIEDDGAGFDPKAGGDSFGLGLVEALSVQLNGETRIESGRGGTRFTLRFPR